MIEFEGVTRSFPSKAGAIYALDDFSLRVPKGETHVLLGSSGSGKTTALRCVNRLETVDAGTVRVGGENVAATDPIVLRRRIGYVLQHGGLFPHMTVMRNVGLLGEVEGREPEAIRARGAELLQLVGLSEGEHGGRYPGELSGGQQQRVGVARALFTDPAYVLMDEPFGALDPITRRALQRDFEDLLARVQKTVLFVTHDVDEAMRLGHRITLMDRGRVVQTGSPADLRDAPVDDFVREFLRGSANMNRFAALLVLVILSGARAQDRIVVASKNFAESTLLAELFAQVIEASTELQVERRAGLGGTLLCWKALTSGEIDLYAEYSGTGHAVILGLKSRETDPLRTFLRVRKRCLDEHGVRWLDPLGFNNTYALAMREDRARELGIRRISDLIAAQGELRGGFSVEFVKREDGLPGLARVYGLELGLVRAMEHALAYPAIESGAIDVMDVYSTDGKLLRYKLRVLEDDRRFFPPYDAAPVVREATLAKHPQVATALDKLAFRISDRAAQAMNYLVEAEGYEVRDVARAMLGRLQIVTAADDDKTARRLAEVLSDEPDLVTDSSRRRGYWATMKARSGAILRLLSEHIALTLAAVLLAIVIAVPIGIASVKRPRLRAVSLGFCGVLQTVPSLALLAFMIPVLGIGVAAAIAALFLYALLPILRNTYTGIAEVDPVLVDAARGLGFRDRETLRLVQLPLASRTIFAGIRTATVISIGVATLAAFIGAGGLGEIILEGLYLNDNALILSGALYAALLALVVDWLLGRLERRFGPRVT